MQPQRWTDATERPPESDVYVIPRVIFDWGLEPVVVLAWAWIYDRGGNQPATVSITAAELAARFNRSRPAAAAWLDILEQAGLIHVFERERGRRGGIRFATLDPREVIVARRGPRDVPTEGRLFTEPTEPEQPENVSAQAPALTLSIEDHQRKCQRTGPSADIIEASCAAETVDTLPALAGCLTQHLGRPTCEMLLRPAVFHVHADRVQVVTVDEFARDYLKRSKRRELVAALAGAGLPVMLEIVAAGEEAGPDPPVENVSAQAPALTLLGQQLFVTEISQEISVTNQTNERDHYEQRRKEEPEENPLLTDAKRIWEAAGDPTCYRWIAILAAWLSREGRLDAAALDKIIADSQAALDFPQRLKAHCQPRGNWLAVRRLKQVLLRDGIKWRHTWERHSL